MPESQHAEYKCQWKDGLLKWLCAFANAEGGTLMVGYDDQGVAAGVRLAQSCRKISLSCPLRCAQSCRSGALAAIAHTRSPSHAPQPQPKSARGLASYDQLHRHERIKDACTQDGYPAPTWTLEPGGWWVTFGYAPQDAAQQVTEPIQRLLSVMVAEHSRNELQHGLNLRHRDSFVATYLQPALAAGVIEMTLPEKPNSRLQKYRLTEVGHHLQAQLKNHRIDH